MAENARIENKYAMNPKNPFISFFAAFLILCIIYRFWFFIDSISIGADWSHLFSYFGYFTMGLINDLTIGIVISTLLSSICFFLKKSFLSNNVKVKQVFRFAETIFLYLLLFIFALAYLAHKKLFLTLFIGLNYSFLRSSLNQGFSLDNYYYYLNMWDWFFIFTPFIIYSIVRKLKYNTLLQLISYILLPLILLSSITGLIIVRSIDMRTGYRFIFYSNPAVFFISSYINNKTNKYAIRQDLPGKSQLYNISLIDPAFVDQSIRHSPIKLTHSKTKDWNIVLIVLESVGLPYIFDTSYGNKIPMPFLHSLAKNGVWFNNNYSSGNNSPLAQFSLFSGLYPNPTPNHFEMQPRLQIPSIANWLGRQYDSFFITPGSTSSFFVNAFINNNGFKEFYSADTIPIKERKKIINYFLDELVSINFFLSRLDRATPPFLAIYWSGAAHYPYLDYGPSYQILANIEDPYSRYLNNLNLLDDEIKRVVELLRNKKLLDDTILIIIGDHGEGFDQHPYSRLHGTTLYQEQIKIPLLFYQPKLFNPQTINHLTSTVDVLPTLLDILGTPFNPNLFQGESLLRSSYRNYVFIYGNEDELAAIDKNGIKTKISFSNTNCSIYNLNLDPKEQQSYSCNPKQESTLIKFRNYQSAMLAWYDKNVPHLTGLE